MLYPFLTSLIFSVQLCVQNSPQEARNMLLQNPQLAYALLQAQVVMRIVDPEIALVSDTDLRIRKSDTFLLFFTYPKVKIMTLSTSVS